MNREDYAEWRDSPITHEVMAMVEDTIEMYKEQLASGTTLGTETAEQTAKHVGVIEGLRYLTRIEYEGE